MLAAHFRDRNLSEDDLNAKADEMFVIFAGPMSMGHLHCSTTMVDAALRIVEERFELT